MGVVGNRAYKVLKEISFERLGGTKEELAALNIIKREIDLLNIENEIEELKDWSSKTDICLSNVISAANNYLEQFEKVPKIHEMLASLEETLCTAQLIIQEIKKHGDA